VNKHLYLCHLLVLSSPTLMMHGHTNLKSVRLSVCMEKLGSNWRDFHENLYLSNFRKSVKNIEISLKSDENNGYFT